MESAIDNRENLVNVYTAVLFCALSVVGAYFLAELVEINRIARLWMHGASFFRYQLVFSLLLWGVLAIYAIRERRRGHLNTLKLTATAVVAAFFCAAVSLISLPAFSGRDITANLTSSQGWLALVTGVGISLSWLTGMLAGLLGSALLQGKRRMVLILIGTCIVVKAIESIAHYHFGERIW
jgi:hypothetical protein